MDLVEKALDDAVRFSGLLYLKDKQKESILTFLGGNDVFVSLPTGYGKSLIYGILPVAFDFLKGKF